MTIKIQGDKITFPDDSEQTTAYTGSGEGGIPEAPEDGKQYGRQDAEWTEVEASTPTPEALVWEDKLAERELDVEYTNTNDVPLYVELYVYSLASTTAYIDFYIDGNRYSRIGAGGTSGRDTYNSGLFIVPSGSDYEVKLGGTAQVNEWHEARMPLAIAVGGASSGGEAQPPVAFNIGVSSDFNLLRGTKTQVPLDNIIQGDDVTLEDDCYIVSKSGFYQLNGSVGITSAAPPRLLVQLWVNDIEIARGVDLEASPNFYNTGFSTTYKLEAGDKVSISATAFSQDGVVGSSSHVTRLSGHMVSSITEGQVKEQEAVVFSGTLKSLVKPNNSTWTKITLDSIDFDTNSVYSDGKFKPIVAGYYSITGSVSSISHGSGGTNSKRTIAGIKVNGGAIHTGSDAICTEGTYNSLTSITTTLVYLDGVNDYVELFGYISSPTAEFDTTGSLTSMTAHLITGQSTGGGSGSSGGSIQVKESKTTEFTSASGNMFNIDDSKPVQTKGHELLTLDFTPQESDSDIFVDVSVPMTSSSENIIGYALFIDDENEALEGTWSKISAPNAPSSPIVMRHLLPKGLTGSHTFKVRYGAYANAGDTSLVQVNGGSGTRYLGGALESKIIITEFPKGIVGGGSGGGDYTPEKMVWEDKLAERELNVTYTNTSDVPLYVNVYSNNTAPKYTQFYIDGVVFGALGANANTNYVTNLFIVPAGSTYQLQNSGGGTDGIYLSTWNEARMPVAVGTGGKTVAFRGELSANQTVLTASNTKVELDSATVDTDNAFADGKFMPSVAGYYQVNASVAQSCAPISTRTICKIFKNGACITEGSDTPSTSSYSNNASDIVYLNGTTDYLELWGYLESTGTCSFNSPPTVTFLSAVLVSGGSASGDSIWTEEDGKAVYDGNVSVAKDLIVANDGYGVCWGRANGSPRIYADEDGELNIVHGEGGVAITIAKNGKAKFYGDVQAQNLPTNGNPSNIYINESGVLYKSTATMYSAEEVDARLAIKDKLIEKLSERLDELEKRVK